MNWAEINPRSWNWQGIGVVAMMSMFVLAVLFVCIGLPILLVGSDDSVNHYNQHFRTRCHKIPNSYTIIANKDKCLVPVNGKIIIKFREH